MRPYTVTKSTPEGGGSSSHVGRDSTTTSLPIWFMPSYMQRWLNSLTWKIVLWLKWWNRNHTLSFMDLKKKGGKKDLSMLDMPLNTTLWIFAEQLSEACCEVCLFLEAFFPSTPFSYACTRQRRPFTHHIVTTWRKSMHKASEPRPFQGKEERKIKCTLAANLTHFSHTHFSADEHCVS